LVANVKEKTMANKKFCLGMLVLALAFGMMVVGCDNDPDPDNNNVGSGGSFTLTNIPSKYNGKYAMYMSEDLPLLVGTQSINISTGVVTPVQISNGSVSLPMWIAGNSGYTRFSGNRTVSDSGVMIVNTSTFTENTDDEDILAKISFESITFSSGNATKSWNDGEVFEF
jgi:hypothetical protein